MTFLVIAGVASLVVVLLYNSLVAKRNRVAQAFSSIDVMLKKRHDLLPNLVAAVRGYSQHEQATLERIAALRTQAIAPGLALGDRMKLENDITGLLGQLRVAVEAYPELKADRNFQHLQATLHETEEQLAASRRACNAAATELNTAIEVFPTNLLAGPLGFGRHPLLASLEAERANPDVASLLAGQGKRG
jgi:LemA protein